MAKQKESKLVPSEPETEDISESYISIGLGLLVVVVVGILLYNYFTQKRSTPAEVQPSESVKASEEATNVAKPGSTYTVQEGDTLWSISEKSYNTGFNWTLIAEANKLSENARLEKGQQLVIPPAPTVVSSSPVALASPEIQPTPTVSVVLPSASPQPTSPATITGTEYTVVKGDTLWHIACRAYGDCYSWTKIAKSNNLNNPDLIHPGNNLTLPR